MKPALAAASMTIGHRQIELNNMAVRRHTYTRQSGLPEFHLADLIADIGLMDEARRAAFALVARDPNLLAPEHQPLMNALGQTRLGFELIHVS
jgi:hypothetical protein